jgi:hypothetical protein
MAEACRPNARVNAVGGDQQIGKMATTTGGEHDPAVGGAHVMDVGPEGERDAPLPPRRRKESRLQIGAMHDRVICAR